MNKDKFSYSISGEFYDRGVLDAVLGDIGMLEALPNEYRERNIIINTLDSTKGRDGVEYKILDGNNLVYVSGEETFIDPRGLRTFRVEEGKLVEISGESDHQ